LADAVDLPLSRVSIRDAQQFGVVDVVVLEVKQTNRSRTDQTTRERRLGHDYHRVQGRTIGSEGVGNESVLEGVSDRGMKDAVQHHQPRRVGEAIFIAASSGDLHQKIDQA
jgi:hypothetical protein